MQYLYLYVCLSDCFVKSYQHGIVGQFWLAAVMSSLMLLFSILASEFRTKAPGAKTFLQVNYFSFSRVLSVPILIKQIRTFL